MKKEMIGAILMLALLSSCMNELDNYDRPNGGIKGAVLDAETNQPIPLPVQGSTGVIINLMEQNTNATKTIDFYARQDGTYENAQVFNCDYNVVINGPFVSRCEGLVTVNGQTVFDLKAMPYARIKASAETSGKKISLTYAVQKTDPSFTVSEVYGYWNFAPGVDDGGANQAGKVTVKAISGTIEFDFTAAKNYLENLPKIQANENKIYLRVGAKTEQVINYSPVITVVLAP